VPAGGRIRSATRAARASCLPALRPAREVLRRDRGGIGGKSAAFGAVFGKPGPTLGPRDESPAGKSRSGTPAGERAPASGGRRKPPFSVARTARRLRADMRHLRLPAFRFLFFFRSSLRASLSSLRAIAKQSSCSLRIWIASSLPLLAMTRLAKLGREKRAARRDGHDPTNRRRRGHRTLRPAIGHREGGAAPPLLQHFQFRRSCALRRCRTG
jgi:hypothetical protein